MAQRTHSVLSASGAKRWLACPGSIWLGLHVKESSNVHAQAGSAAHFVSECIQRDNLDEDEAIQALEQYHPIWFEVFEDQDRDDFFNSVWTYIDWMREKIEANPSIKVSYEQRVSLEFIDKNMFGTADFIQAELFGTLECADFKHGKGVVVEVEDNEQQAYYTLGTAYRYGFNFETVAMNIIQPRAPHVEGPIRRQEIPMEEFKDKWIPEFTNGVIRVKEARDANNIEDHLFPGDHCDFCPVRATCPKLREKTMEIVKMDFDAVAPQGRSLPAPAELTMKQLTDILDHAGMIDSWIKAVNAHAQSLIDAGTDVPGYKIVPSRPTRKWIDEKKVKASLSRRKGLVPEDYFVEPKLRSPNQMQGKHKRNNPKLWASLQKYIHKTSGSRTLAREDDKRPALEHKKAGDDFDAVS